MSLEQNNSDLENDGRRTAFLPLTFSMIYNSFLVPKARELGYALCIHGSMGRDLDLVAVPWTEEAVTARKLLEELRIVANASYVADHWLMNGPKSEKPHGRVAWSLIPSGFGSRGYIDISVMPRRRRRKS